MKRLIVINLIVLLLVIGVVATTSAHDIDGDGQIGLPEAIHALQIIAGGSPSSGAMIVSGYHDWGVSLTQAILLTVPADKHFILVDIVGEAYITIYENDTPKLKTRVGGTVYSSTNGSVTFPNPITLSTGIVFNPGTEVRVIPSRIHNNSNLVGNVTLSGYFY